MTWDRSFITQAERFLCRRQVRFERLTSPPMTPSTDTSPDRIAVDRPAQGFPADAHGRPRDLLMGLPGLFGHAVHRMAGPPQMGPGTPTQVADDGGLVPPRVVARTQVGPPFLEHHLHLPTPFGHRHDRAGLPTRVGREDHPMSPGGVRSLAGHPPHATDSSQVSIRRGDAPSRRAPGARHANGPSLVPPPARRQAAQRRASSPIRGERAIAGGHAEPRESLVFARFRDRRTEIEGVEQDTDRPPPRPIEGRHDLRGQVRGLAVLAAGFTSFEPPVLIAKASTSRHRWSRWGFEKTAVREPKNR